MRASVVAAVLLVAATACSHDDRRATSSISATAITRGSDAPTASSIPLHVPSSTSQPTNPAAPASSSEPVSTVAATSAAITATTTRSAAVTAVRISKGTKGRPVVAVTFDAGSDTGSTTRILDILASNHIRASFGVTGRWAENNPELFKRIAASHQVINHTYDHRSFTGYSTHTAPLTEAERLAEIRRADDVYRRVAGISSAPYFRAPFGDLDPATDRLLGAIGYRYDVLYTADSRGWQGADPAAIVRNCRAGEVPGGIIVFHVGSASRDVDALQQVINDIRTAGLTSGAVSDLT